MRCIMFLVGASVLVLCANLARGSEGVDDVVKLQQSGLSPDVITAFVENSSIAYDLTADEITKLQNAGVPATAIVAMIDHGKELRAKLAPAAPVANAPATAAPEPAAPVTGPRQEQRQWRMARPRVPSRPLPRRRRPLPRLHRKT